MDGLRIMLKQAEPIALDVEFACAQGEFTALVGPSGSGKSTVLRCIAGLYHPTNGRITVGNQVWLDIAAQVDMPTWRRRVGLVAQTYALFPHLTASANIEAAINAPTQAEKHRRARELLSVVNLTGLEDRWPHQLSGGQQQRVAVARALARDPDILLLDEPFSAVDKFTRTRLYQELAGIRDRLKMPVVLVTHDLDEAMMLADTLCLVQRGRILQKGRPLEVVNHPESVDAARLVGHRNVFPARVQKHVSDQSRTILDWRGHRLEVRHQPKFAAGTDVAWMIPASKIILHRRDRPSRGEAENPVHGHIARFIPLGDMVLLSIALASGEKRAMSMQIQAHVAERNQLKQGSSISMSLIADAIHLMAAPEPRQAPR